MKYFFETYGCQMNAAESAALRLAARERGWAEAESPEEADLVLLNTCAVRITAEQRVFGRLAHFAAEKKKRGRPFSLVIAGCMAERLGATLKEDFPALDFVMGTSARALFPLVLEQIERNGPGAPLPASLIEEKPAFSFSPCHLEGSALRSFVPIMQGCDNFCSYCIVPFVRGREVSRSPDSILGEIRLAAEKGVREITLLGQNVNSYRWSGESGIGSRESAATPLPLVDSRFPIPDSRFPTPLNFPGLLTLIASEIEGSPLRWVRFLSSHPKDLSPETIAVMAGHPCFCRHLHLPVQHGANGILAGMNRRYTREQYLGLVRLLREAMPGMSLSTDILVGFPGETEADLEETLSLMEEVRFLYSFMYHYNPREGTAAYDLPGRVSEEVKRERLARVITVQKKHTRELLSGRIGAKVMVLIEGISRKNTDNLIGRTERDEMVVFPGRREQIGSFGEVTLSVLKGNTFISKGLPICYD